jgi:hypothetical protein
MKTYIGTNNDFGFFLIEVNFIFWANCFCRRIASSLLISKEWLDATLIEYRRGIK